MLDNMPAAIGSHDSGMTLQPQFAELCVLVSRLVTIYPGKPRLGTNIRWSAGRRTSSQRAHALLIGGYRAYKAVHAFADLLNSSQSKILVLRIVI